MKHPNVMIYDGLTEATMCADADFYANGTRLVLKWTTEGDCGGRGAARVTSDLCRGTEDDRWEHGGMTFQGITASIAIAVAHGLGRCAIEDLMVFRLAETLGFLHIDGLSVWITDEVPEGTQMARAQYVTREIQHAWRNMEEI